MIACIVPSRGRPGNIRELIEAWGKTTTGHADLIIAIDKDDPEFDNYPPPIELPEHVMVHHGPRLRLGGTLNKLARIAVRREGGGYDAIGFMGDDHRPRTAGWDAQIAEALEARPLGVVYGDDLVHGPGLPTAVFMDSRIIRTLGWMVYPGMTHLFFDNLWKRLGEELGTLTYLDDVIIEHCHPVVGKAAWDAGYAEVNSQEVWAHDEALFNEWVAKHMAADVARLKASI